MYVNAGVCKKEKRISSSSFWKGLQPPRALARDFEYRMPTISPSAANPNQQSKCSRKIC